ncbi:MAG: CoA transferase [Alphaproteobacteria bacterium]|nr:CoA transferase [Alphaproteobacteria bacterium]
MGALKGVKVVEFAGIGPGPFSCMLLSDMGADVIRIDRAQNVGRDTEEPRYSPTLRGRPNLAIDLKSDAGRETALKLCDQADILIEGFRPGVMERLGLGPEAVHVRNPKLIYGRMTGWGQDGPIAMTAGHDINYIALSGALHAIGTRDGGPVPPLNLVGDFGGGALYLVMGVLAAYIEAQKSGKGQVVDVSMVEGAASLMAMFYGRVAAAQEGDQHVRSWTEERESNFLDGGSHYYNTYETADGEHICIGSIEPQFYKLLLDTVGLTDDDLGPQNDKSGWEKNKATLAQIFKTKTRDEWTEIMGPTDICFAPVLRMSEAPKHPHNAARGSFVEVGGVTQPGPAPKFSRTAIATIREPSYAGQDSRGALLSWGFDQSEVDRLIEAGAVRQR